MEFNKEKTTITTDNATLFTFSKVKDPTISRPADVTWTTSMFWEQGNNRYYDGESRVMYMLELLTYTRPYLIDTWCLGKNQFEACDSVKTVKMHNILPTPTPDVDPILIKQIKKNTGDVDIDIADDQLFILVNKDRENNVQIVSNAPDFDVYFGMCMEIEQVIRDNEAERYPGIELFKPTAIDAYPMDRFAKAVQNYFK